MSSRARLAGLALAAVIVAACGGSGTPAPSAAASAAASSSPSSAAPSTELTASSSPSSAAPSTEPATGDAAAALANLTSYKFKIAIASTNVTSGLWSTLGDISMEGTAVLKPTPAADVVMKMGSSGSSMDFHIIQVGDKSWMNLGTSWTETTDASQTSLMDSLSPAALFGAYVGSDAGGMNAVGDETKNGIACTHMQAGAAALVGMNAALASAFGVDGTWSVDYWVAKDGGYLVSSIMKGTGPSAGKTSEVSVSIDLSDLNNPANVVTAPM